MDSNEKMSFGEWFFSEEMEEIVNKAVGIVGVMIIVAVLVKIAINVL